uniref:MAP2/Tau projection domain-containing protein n=1 Tax=Oncorhynchus tshawytscha TaxID=74940 RepID=A0A8C8LU55_ONCTS
MPSVLCNNLKMDMEKPGSESGCLSPDFTEPECPAFSSGDHTAPPLYPKTEMASPSPSLSNSQSQAKEPTKMSIPDVPKTVSEKQPSVEVLESSNLTTVAVSGFTRAGDKDQGQGVSSDSNKDKSGMSSYFETLALKADEGSKEAQAAEGYYELSTAGLEKSLGRSSPTVTSPPEINYSMLAQTQSVEKKPDTKTSPMGDQKDTLPALDRSNECRLSPGKLALDQRSYSLNITIGSMDPSGQGLPRNFSPLATDIMSFTSGSLDESVNYLPVTTLSAEKVPPPFPPLILETAASVTSDSSSPPYNTGEIPGEKTSPQGSESPESPFPPKYYYKNGTVMAPDLPEMLDLAGTRSRLASENNDPETMRRKSVPADAQGIGSDSLANLVLGDQNQSQGLAKSESQLEELGYCVFSEYSGPMPSPADLHSPIDSPPQRFTPMALEEKMAEEKLKIEARDKLAEDEKTNQLIVCDGSKEKEEAKQVERKDSASEEKDNKEISHEKSAMEDQNDKPASALKSAESFVTPTVMVTLDEEGKAENEGPETDAEIAAYERQIRRLEMEDRPLSMEEERELQELREKVKDKFLVHQEAYEEVDAEDVYQLTGVAKDRISRPARPSPASSVESTTEEEKVPVMDTEKPKQTGGQTTPPKVDFMATSPSVSGGGVSTTEEEKVPVMDTEKPKQTGGQTTAPKVDFMATSPSVSGGGVSTTEEEKGKVSEEKLKKEQVVEVKEKNIEEKKKEDGEEDNIEQVVEQEEIMIEIKPTNPGEKEEKFEKDIMKDKEEEEEEEEDGEVLAGAGAAVDDVPEPRAAIESVVTVEDDFITVVQTIDEGEEPGHSVRFSAPPEPETPQALHEQEEEEEEESQEVEIMEAASLEEVGDVSEEVCEKEVQASPEKEVQTETEGQTESYDRDETTMDDSILDSSWVDTQDLCTVDVDDDKSMATEQIEPLRADRVPAPPVKKEKTPQHQKQEKQPVNPKAKGGRVKASEGHVSTPERKPIHKQPVYIPREDVKKKKAVIKKTELTKKAEMRSSPSRKSVLKSTAVRHSRPAQAHPCARRKPTVGVPEGRRPLSVARQSRDRASSPPLTKIPTCKM